MAQVFQLDYLLLFALCSPTACVFGPEESSSGREAGEGGGALVVAEEQRPRLGERREPQDPDIRSYRFDGHDVDYFIDMTRGEVSERRAFALAALGYIYNGFRTEPSGSVLPYWIDGLDKRERQRFREQETRRAKLIVPCVVASLTDRVASVRLAAATALAHIGPEAHLAETALRSALRDPDEEVQLGAALALYFIAYDWQTCLAVSWGFLQHEKAVVRRGAVYNMARLGGKACQALEDVEKLQSDVDPDVRDWAGIASSVIRKAREEERRQR